MFVIYCPNFGAFGRHGDTDLVSAYNRWGQWCDFLIYDGSN